MENSLFRNVSLPPMYIPFLLNREVRAHSPDEVVKTTQEKKIHNFFRLILMIIWAIGLHNICGIC